MLHCPSSLSPTATALPHSAEALYENSLQKCGCMSSPHPRVGCQCCCCRKQWIFIVSDGNSTAITPEKNCHACRNLDVSPSSKGGMLQCPYMYFPMVKEMPSLRRSTVWCTPADIWVYQYMSFPLPMLGCYIVHLHCLQGQQQYHHSGEALYGHSLQRSECMPPVLLPKVGCCIVPFHCPRQQQHSHRSRGGLYESGSHMPLLEARPIWSRPVSCDADRHAAMLMLCGDWWKIGTPKRIRWNGLPKTITNNLAFRWT